MIYPIIGNEDSNGLNGENGFFMQQNSQEDFQGFQDHNSESNSKLVTKETSEQNENTSNKPVREKVIKK